MKSPASDDLIVISDDSPSPPHHHNISERLIPGRIIYCRYRTYSNDSEYGVRWRRVVVNRLGNSSETKYGKDSRKEGVQGVWANIDKEGGDIKFYRYDRFIEVTSHVPSDFEEY